MQKVLEKLLQWIQNMNDIRYVALDLLRDCYEDEIAHLNLRIIRDNQAPRFKALEESHPEIYRDFMEARGVHHEILKRNRDKRVEQLKKIIESV